MNKSYKINGITFVGVTEYPENPTNGDIIYRSDFGKIMTYQNSWFELGGIGATGIQGIQGTNGLRGYTGIQGTTGISIYGETGIQGNTGLQGVTGIDGVTGIQGVTGMQGTNITVEQLNSIITKRITEPANNSLFLNNNNINAISNLRGVEDTEIAPVEQGSVNRRYNLGYLSEWQEDNETKRNFTVDGVTINDNEPIVKVECYVNSFGNPDTSVANPSCRNLLIFDIWELPANKNVYIKRYWQKIGESYVLTTCQKKIYTGNIYKTILNIDADGLLAEFLSVNVIGNAYGSDIEFESPVSGVNIRRIMPDFNSDDSPNWASSDISIERTSNFQRPVKFNTDTIEYPNYPFTYNGSNEQQIIEDTTFDNRVINWGLIKACVIAFINMKNKENKEITDSMSNDSTNQWNAINNILTRLNNHGI